jgi:hypothetical protein
MNNNIVFKEKYRNLYLVDTLDMWGEFSDSYDSNLDLVLTYDLALKLKIEALFGEVYYIDHLVEQSEMHQNNFVVYDFFAKWHLDAQGNDLFVYKGVDFGFSFRLEFWNDYISYMRVYFCLSKVREIDCHKFYASTYDQNILDVISRLGLSATIVDPKGSGSGYFFPIAQWMNEQIRPSKLRGALYAARSIVTALYGSLTQYVDRLCIRKPKYSVFLQEYHPTKEILRALRADDEIRLLLCNFSRGSSFFDKFKERLIPVYTLRKYSDKQDEIVAHYQSKKAARLVVSDGSDLSDIAYDMIESRVFSVLPKTIATLESCIRYLNNNSLDLAVLIANIGYTATLFDCVCKSKGIPSYLIINGLLGPDYSDESKYASYINSYSQSIKANYFKGMDNVYPLGDPRMDAYAVQDDPKVINRDNPTVVVGASGFNSIDLNSFVSVEFEFIYTVLLGLNQIRTEGQELNVIIKVRPNGYSHQYEKLLSEYFSDFPAVVIDSEPMRNVLERADFYISIYSQTLFEASCLGVPALYFRIDNEIMHSPFDMNSELVTVSSQSELVTAFYDFLEGDRRYDKFLDREVMEKYVGPLDGNNLTRNKEFIYDLLDRGSQNAKGIH